MSGAHRTMTAEPFLEDLEARDTDPGDSLTATGSGWVVAAVDRATAGRAGAQTSIHTCAGEQTGIDPLCDQCVREYLERRRRAK